MSLFQRALVLESASEERRLAGCAAASETDRQLDEIQRLFQKETAADLPRLRRAWTLSHRRVSDIAAVLEASRRLRDRFRVLVSVGIGGSILSARVFHDVLNSPYHNLRSEARGSAPEVYFAGGGFDPARLGCLLAMLEERNLLEKTLVNAISKSGRTVETLAALALLRERLKERTGESWSRRLLVTTDAAEGNALYQMSREKALFTEAPLPIRGGVGGRFSAFSAVGLLFLAATTPADQTPEERVGQLLAGVETAHRRFQLPHGNPDNIAYRIARWLHILEKRGRRNALVFYNGSENPRLGEWFAQLYAESIQERGTGFDALPALGPASNHTALNGVLNGPQNKAALMAQWESLGADLVIPNGAPGEMRAFEGLSMTQAQNASLQATAEELRAHGVPVLILKAPARDAQSLGELMRTLMDAVAVKGRLQNLHLDADRRLRLSAESTYLQTAVEGYKTRTRKYAEAQKKVRDS